MKKKLPAIGFRIIKSSVAIALCFLVDYFRHGAGIVFYSQLSALWCMQVYRNNTRKNALQRTIGTSIGAIYGLLFLLANRAFNKPSAGYDVSSAIFISLMIIVVLYTTVLIKKKQASYFSCVVFLSIVVNHIGDADPYLFVWNRFLDTMIGIMIGILVNNFEFPAKKDRDTLFISTMDETLLNSDEKLSDYSKVELNRLIEDGLNFTIATMRTPGVIAENMADVQMKYPVIAMDGAVLYDVASKSYLKSYVISAERSKELRWFIEKYSKFYFTNIVIDDTLLIYYQEGMTGAMKQVVDKLHFSPYRNYIMRPAPDDEDVVYFMILDEKQKVRALYDGLVDFGYTKRFKVVFYDSSKYPGCSYLKIFNRNASMEHMMDYLLEYSNLSRKVTLGTIPGKYDVYITGKNGNEAVKNIKSIYRKNYSFTRRK